MDKRYTWAREYLDTVQKLWNEDEYGEARKVLQSILREEPGFGKAHAYAGWDAQYQLEDNELARIHYEFAFKFDPSDSYLYEHYAELLIEEKDEQGMKVLFEEGGNHVKVDKASLYNDYGRVLEIAGKNKDASRYYKEGMKFTMSYFMLQTLRANRKRARFKHRFFDTWYALFV